MRCTICDSDFTTKRGCKHAKFCSHDCRKENARRITGRVSAYENLTSGTVGAISELVAGTYLLEQGWAVFRALSPSCFCDLVAFKENESPMFLEVRTGYKNLSNDKITFSRNVKKNVTHFLVVEGTQEKRCHLIPV